MSTRFAPSADGLAFEYFTVQRASRSFCASLAGLERPGLGDAALLQRPLLVLGVALLRRRHHGRVDDLPAHGDVARSLEHRVEAPEQRLDRRDAADRGPRQRLAEGPDRVRVRHPVRQRQPEKAHEREPVLDEILGPLVRQRVAGLQDQDPEHQHVVVGRAAAPRPIRARHGLLELGPERLEIHQRVHPLKIVALRGQLPQPRVDVKQPRFPRHDPPHRQS